MLHAHPSSYPCFDSYNNIRSRNQIVKFLFFYIFPILHFHNQVLDTVEGGSMFLRSIVFHRYIQVASQPKRPET
jgi:hypothetical protein